jgi:hypothetical protein
MFSVSYCARLIKDTGQINYKLTEEYLFLNKCISIQNEVEIMFQKISHNCSYSPGGDRLMLNVW